MISRAIIDETLHDARVAAYPAGEFVGQESFMSACDIVGLGTRAGIGPGTDVLDVCCGLGGAGRHLQERTRCRYVGVDMSAEAIALARARTEAAGVPSGACRYVVAAVPPLPGGRFDVVVLFETLLAFRQKRALVASVAGALRPGGRFVLTAEVGVPLGAAERSGMPHADTVWPVGVRELDDLLRTNGFAIAWWRDATRTQLRTVTSLTSAFAARRAELVAGLGEPFVDDLLAAHRLWGRWLRTGRIRKLAVVAQRR